MAHALINIDKTFPACTAIDTEGWLSAVLGDEVLLSAPAKFVAGWNMPGYMPDSEPAEFDTFEEAREYIADTLSDWAFNEEESDEQTTAYEEGEQAVLSQEDEFSFQIGTHVFWVAEGTARDLEEDIRDKWLMQAEDTIKAAIESEEGQEYACTRVDNTYNNENDFSSDFQWQVWYPAESSDWCYANDVYVAIEGHQGGDVRGNYGRVRLFKLDNVADSGFFDWCLGWNVTYSNGDDVSINDRFSVGYSSNPFYEMEKHMKEGERGIKWSEKRECFVGWFEDGRAVELRPYLYV